MSSRRAAEEETLQRKNLLTERTKKREVKERD
jgi:hypothetical protein